MNVHQSRVNSQRLDNPHWQEQDQLEFQLFSLFRQRKIQKANLRQKYTLIYWWPRMVNLRWIGRKGQNRTLHYKYSQMTQKSDTLPNLAK